MPHPIDHISPMIAVERHAVDKERDRPLALLDIGDPPGFDLGKAPARVKARDIHDVRSDLFSETNLGPRACPRCHDLANVDADALPQHRGRSTEEALEARREVAVAGKARLKRDR